ncbi:MAG: ACT domain-containing protein [Opitutaceae bacterium]|jgi:glycine cleavage system regulatory protein
MLSNLTMTIIAGDRPGLVQLVADRVAAHGGNWLESRMCRLGGQFAGIVRVAVPSDKASSLEKSLSELEKQGLRILIHTEGAAEISSKKGTLVKLDIVGHDRPGIVRQITSVLASHGVNVEEFGSECVNSPMDGAQLFQAHALVLIPPSIPLSLLRGELEKIASDLMVDVQLGPPGK